jgi:hypothetical protein
MRLFMLVSLTFILCFGGSISAECSWILWSKVTLDPGKAKKAKVNSIPEFEWEIEQSHTTLVACQNPWRTPLKQANIV